MFSTRTSPSKWVTDPAFEAGRLAASPMAKMFGATSDCSVCGSVATKSRASPSPGESADVGGAAVHRDDDGQVEGDLALVVADEPSAVAVDLAGVELGDQLDAALLEHPAERRRRGRLGERAVQRGDVGELDLVADAAFVEVPVGQEAELERRHRALDRHVDHVDDEPTALEAVELRRQRGGAVEVVEREDLLHPARPGQPLGLLRDEAGAGGDDQHVVVERRAVGQVHPLGPRCRRGRWRTGGSRSPSCSCLRRGRTMSSGSARPNGTNSRPGW